MGRSISDLKVATRRSVSGMSDDSPWLHICSPFIMSFPDLHPVATPESPRSNAIGAGLHPTDREEWLYVQMGD